MSNFSGTYESPLPLDFRSSQLEKEDVERIIKEFLKQQHPSQKIDRVEIKGLPENLHLKIDAYKINRPKEKIEEGGNLNNILQSECYNHLQYDIRGYRFLVWFAEGYLEDKIDNSNELKEEALLSKVPIEVLLRCTTKEAFAIAKNPRGRGWGRKTMDNIKETLVNMGYKQKDHPFLQT